MDRFELNAMVERLLESEGADEAAREAVAKFASGMKRSSRWRFQSKVSTPGDKMTGQTNLGTVQLEDDRPVEHSVSLGEREERIGQYKLTRQRGDLDITHFWKSDIGTFSDSELPQAWRMCLDRNERPVWFGERGMKRVFSLPIAGKYVRLVVDREFYVKRWGTEGPDVRPGAFALQVYVGNDF